jgi:hypothetical protein
VSGLTARADHEAERVQGRRAGRRLSHDLAVRRLGLLLLAGADVGLGFRQPARDGVVQPAGMWGGNGVVPLANSAEVDLRRRRVKPGLSRAADRDRLAS